MKELFLSDELLEGFQEMILKAENDLIQYCEKDNANKFYIKKEKNRIELEKEYFVASQQLILQLERKAPINNFINYNTVSYDNSNVNLLRENKELKKQIELLQNVLNYHCISYKDVHFILTDKKEFLRQASINKLRNEMPQLF